MEETNCKPLWAFKCDSGVGTDCEITYKGEPVEDVMEVNLSIRANEPVVGTVHLFAPSISTKFIADLLIDHADGISFFQRVVYGAKVFLHIVFNRPIKPYGIS